MVSSASVASSLDFMLNEFKQYLAALFGVLIGCIVQRSVATSVKDLHHFVLLFSFLQVVPQLFRLTLLNKFENMFLFT